MTCCSGLSVEIPGAGHLTGNLGTEAISPGATIRRKRKSALDRPESQPESIDLQVMGLADGAKSKAELAAGLGHTEVSGQLRRPIYPLFHERANTLSLRGRTKALLKPARRDTLGYRVCFGQAIMTQYPISRRTRLV